MPEEIIYKDFIGEELKIGQTVIYLHNCRTGSSTMRKCKFIGTIIDFSNKRAVIEPHGNYDTFVGPDEYQHLPAIKIYTDDIICIISE